MRRPLVLIAALALLARPRIADACAPAPPDGIHVAVTDESAIIVWDEATKTEHFIRNATFRAEGSDFGFLVPTPTKPELAEASEQGFAVLEDAIKPEVVYRDEWRLEPTLLAFWWTMRASKSAAIEFAAPPGSPVRVLESKRVGDYAAVVLEADNAAALGEWLTSHGYAKRTALEEWLGPYVAQKWKLTAFKIADDVPKERLPSSPFDPSLGTRAVRMSFKTERPLFPYREPRDQREGVPPALQLPRSLRVFFVGPERVVGTIGSGATPFPGKLAWTAPLPPLVAANLPVRVAPNRWLTAFLDDATPRPGVDELWFDRAPQQTPIKPPPIERINERKIPVPIDVLVFVFGVGGFFVVRRLRRRVSRPV